MKQVGGVAVGVASDEPECQTVDEWKRKRLIGVGADYIVPNFLCHQELFARCFRKIRTPSTSSSTAPGSS